MQEGPSPDPRAAGRIAAVVLAGGASTRFGSDKLATRRAGTTLLDSVLRGAAMHAERVVVVGPLSEREESGRAPEVIRTIEDPPGGGPVAAVAAALAVIDAEIVLLLAGDAPNGPDAAPALLDVLRADDAAAAAILVDPGGRPQMLCGAYRTAMVRSRLDDLARERGTHAVAEGDDHAPRTLPPLHGAAMRDLVAGLVIVQVSDEWHAAEDVDTRADADRLGFT